MLIFRCTLINEVFPCLLCVRQKIYNIVIILLLWYCEIKLQKYYSLNGLV